MSYITIGQAAILLGVNKRTLMRWDESGKFPAKREPISKTRFYDEQEITNHSLWFKLRRKHKNHNKKLGAIRSEVNKYISTQPLNLEAKPEFHNLEEMKKAYDALNKWTKEDEKILEEYSNLLSRFKPKINLGD